MILSLGYHLRSLTFRASLTSCALWFALACLAFGQAQTDQAKAVPVDLILKGGTLVDGTGQAARTGDVAIADGKIVAVGDLRQLSALQSIDCSKLIIAPGFIDLHNHSDDPIVSAPTRACVNYLTQGCTTIVTGNCGSGPVNVADYLSKIDQHGAGTNVLHLLPHGSLRSQVLGQVARDPSAEELEKMTRLAEQAMQDGAWGMSTGLIYVPGTYSKTEELIAVAKVVAAHGGIYASHIRNEGSGLMDAIQEAIRIGREADLPVHVSHFKSSGRDNWGRLHIAAELIEAARKDGLTVTADQYPYTASSTSLDATLLPTWSREGGRKHLEQRLSTPSDRQRIVEAVAKQLESKSRIQIAAYPPRRDWVGKSLDEIATLEKRPAVDIVLEIESKGGAKVVNFGMSEEDVKQAMSLPWLASASDGSSKIPSADQPHPRSFGTFTRKLGRYALAEKVIELPLAVRSCSGLPADIIGLRDRGYIKPGLVADICVFDPQEVMDQATYDEPFRYSTGIRYVLVGGQFAIHAGTPTGALAGKALRKPNR